MQRARILAAFGDKLDAGDALDLEHACHWSSKASDCSYRRVALYALYALETSAFAEMVKSKGGAAALACSEEQIFGVSDAHRAVQDAEKEQRECRSLITDLTSDGGIDLPEAGVRCSRCGSNEVSFEFCQTRSADEGTTVYCCCLSCSKRWKM